MSAFEIKVNDQTKAIQDGCTIRNLLDDLGIRSTAIAVEINCKLQPRDTFEKRILAAGDRVEIVTLVGGG